MPDFLWTEGLLPTRFLCPWNYPGKNGRVAIPFFRGSSQPRARTQIFCIAGRFFAVWATGEARMDKELCMYAMLLSHVQLFETLMDCRPPGSSVHGISQARILVWVAISLLHRVFPTQGSNWSLLYKSVYLHYKDSVTPILFPIFSHIVDYP